MGAEAQPLLCSGSRARVQGGVARKKEHLCLLIKGRPCQSCAHRVSWAQQGIEKNSQRHCVGCSSLDTPYGGWLLPFLYFLHAFSTLQIPTLQRGDVEGEKTHRHTHRVKFSASLVSRGRYMVQFHQLNAPTRDFDSKASYTEMVKQEPLSSWEQDS